MTNDKDFGELVFRSGRKHTGVILFRLHDESPSNRVRLMRILVETYADRLFGNFIVTTEKGVRIRTVRKPK